MKALKWTTPTGSPWQRTERPGNKSCHPASKRSCPQRNLRGEGGAKDHAFRPANMFSYNNDDPCYAPDRIRLVAYLDIIDNIHYLWVNATLIVKLWFYLVFNLFFRPIRPTLNYYFMETAKLMVHGNIAGVWKYSIGWVHLFSFFTFKTPRVLAALNTMTNVC